MNYSYPINYVSPLYQVLRAPQHKLWNHNIIYALNLPKTVIFAVVDALPSIFDTVHVYVPSFSNVTGLMCKVLPPLIGVAFEMLLFPSLAHEYVKAGSP